MSETLKLASPYIKGKRVGTLQRAVNGRLRNHGIPRKVKVDGEYGPATRSATRTALDVLGLDVGRFDKYGLLPSVYRKVIDPKKRNSKDRRRAKARAPRIKRTAKRLRAEQHGPKMAIAYGKKFVGMTETPYGSNRGPKIDDWQRACGFLGAPWCGMYVNAMLRAGGFANQPWLAYCPSIESRAKSGTDGWRWVRPGNLDVGDVVLYGSGIAQHTGIYIGDGVTLEGNTSFGTAGSQANGGAVALRRRDLSGGGAFPLRGAARPPWKKL
jgi:hypothetical protein